MKRYAAIITLLFFSFLTPVPASDTGPTLSAVSDRILNISEEDGTWKPLGDWWLWGVDKTLPVTTITDKHHNIIDSVTWNTKKDSDGWSKITGVSDLSENGEQRAKLSPGRYTLALSVGKKEVWHTGFEVIKVHYKEKDHFYITGPWKDLAYFYTSRGANGSFICFWFEGPVDFDWYPPKKKIRTFYVMAEIKQDGETIIEQDTDPLLNKVKIIPGKVERISFSISDEDTIAKKMLSRDGEYEITVYFGENLGGKGEKWFPAARLIVPVVKGQVVKNEKLSGKKSDSLTRIITTSAYYDRNHIEEPIPSFNVK